MMTRSMLAFVFFLCAALSEDLNEVEAAIKSALAVRDGVCFLNKDMNAANKSTSNASVTEMYSEPISTMIYSLITHQKCNLPIAKGSEITPANGYTWLYSLLSASAINIAALSGGCFKPIMNRPVFMWILMWMIGVGVGSMCSVSILQLIPEALNIELAGVERWKVVLIMVAIFAFYLIDRFLNVLRYAKVCSNNEEESSDSDHLGDEFPTGYKREDTFGQLDITQIKHGFSKWCLSIPPIVWMVFVGDALHNFVDGVTIGTAFSDTPKRGLSTFLGIFFEELPCELGDFAVFIKSGLTLRTAILFNIISASTNYIGLVAGILISGFQSSVHSWIYCVAGGMFLYISLGVMLGEMRDMEDRLVEKEKLKQNRKIVYTIIRIIMVQISGLVIGFGIQLAVLYITLEPSKTM